MATVNQQTTKINTPAIKTDAAVLLANPERIGWSIQNVGTNPLRICLGGTASSTVFHLVLKGGTGDNDGLGATASQTSGTIYTGAITADGTSMKYVVIDHS